MKQHSFKLWWILLLAGLIALLLVTMLSSSPEAQVDEELTREVLVVHDVVRKVKEMNELGKLAGDVFEAVIRPNVQRRSRRTSCLQLKSLSFARIVTPSRCL